MALRGTADECVCLCVRVRVLASVRSFVQLSANSGRVLGELLPRYVDTAGMLYVEGAVDETTALLKQKVRVAVALWSRRFAARRRFCWC